MSPAPGPSIDGFQYESEKGYGIFSKILFYLVVLGRLELNNARNGCILNSNHKPRYGLVSSVSEEGRL